TPIVGCFRFDISVCLPFDRPAELTARSGNLDAELARVPLVLAGEADLENAVRVLGADLFGVAPRGRGEAALERAERLLDEHRTEPAVEFRLAALAAHAQLPGSDRHRDVFLGDARELDLEQHARLGSEHRRARHPGRLVHVLANRLSGLE